VVIMAVDGLSTEQLLKYRPWYASGLKRLLEEGHRETKSRYRHINTETGPGHASLGAGAPPRVTGIVANNWLERDGATGALRQVYCTDSLALDPTTSRPIPSADRLMTETLGDRLVAASPRSRVVSISAKDRSAILMAGKTRTHAAYWFDRPNLRFTTSSAYTPPADAAALLQAYNRVSMGVARLGARFGAEWNALEPPANVAALPAPAPSASFADFQLPVTGLLFPHRYASGTRGLGEAFYASPVADELVADIATHFLSDDQILLGRRGVPDLLAMSFSAHDVVSHNYGSESAETLDVLRRLDAQIARVLNALDRVLPGRYLLGFSADHGFSVIPEAQRTRPGLAGGGRLVTSARSFHGFADRTNRFMRNELCLPASATPAELGDSWNVFYASRLRSLDSPVCGPAKDIGTADLDRAFAKALETLYAEEIRDVRFISEKDRWPADEITPFLLNGYYEGRSGGAFVIGRRHVIQHWDPGRGSGHGSLYDYDTEVPLIFLGRGFAKGDGTNDDAAPYDLAVTLADAIGVALPKATGKSRLPRRIPSRSVFAPDAGGGLRDAEVPTGRRPMAFRDSAK
jgi:predicted AlkP superfamily pyrophosphatase or phosphodiesterase